MHRIVHAYTFHRQERLKSRKLIGQLFKEGKSVNSYPLKLYYLFADKEERRLKAGFTASAKLFKKAVHRNRIKRLMREAYRLHKNELESILQNKQLHLVVFFVYNGRELPDFLLVKTQVKALVQKMARILHEKTAAHT